MSDFSLEDIEEMSVDLELEDGSVLSCEVLYIFEWGGDDYAALTPVDESIEEIYFFGIELEDNGGGEPEITLLEIDDQEVLDALADAFDEMIREEEEEEEDSEEDAKWDEFINKKLD